MSDVTVKIGGTIDIEELWKLAYRFTDAAPGNSPGQDAGDIVQAFTEASIRGEYVAIDFAAGMDLDAGLLAVARAGLSFSVLRSNDDGTLELDVFDPSWENGRFLCECNALGQPVVEFRNLVELEREGRVPQILRMMEMASTAPDKSMQVIQAPGSVLSR